MKQALLLFVYVVGMYELQAQQPQEKEASLDGGTLKSQYEYLIDASNDYQEYKVIRKTWTSKFGKSLNDSIAAIEAAKNEAATLAKSQQEKITTLQNQLQATQDSLQLVKAEKNSMALLGVPMKKTGYKMTMWGIIGLLALLLLVFIFRYRNSNRVTRNAKASLQEVEDEFTEFKKRSLEREQKLRRELQDEINKQRGV